MVNTGYLTQEQVALTQYPHSHFEIVGTDNSVIHIPRTYNSPVTAVYEIVTEDDGNPTHKAFIVDKTNMTWMYEENTTTNTTPDENTIITNNDVLTLNVAEFISEKTETIKDGTKGFASISDATSTVNGLLDNTRKINSKALSSDITLTVDDVSGVPTSRKVNGIALSKTGLTLGLSNIKRLYQHNIMVKNSYYRWIRFTIYNNSSTAIKSKDAIAKYLYDNGFRNTTNIYPSRGFDGSNGNRTGWSGLYATSATALYVHETPKQQWTDFNTLFPSSSTWRDDVVTLV